LTIHLLEDGAYRQSPESCAFPGWRAAEIHTAMSEASASTSAATGQVLGRVARALGDRDGAGPDDTPWLRAQRREVRTASRAEGHAEGRDKGYAEGRARVMEALARGLPASRGISGSGPGSTRRTCGAPPTRTSATLSFGARTRRTSAHGSSGAAAPADRRRQPLPRRNPPSTVKSTSRPATTAPDHRLGAPRPGCSDGP